jgi:hypothetical protein
LLLIHESSVADPDPHQSGKLDPDLDPHQNETPDPDPDPDQHQREKVEPSTVILEHWKVHIWRKVSGRIRIWIRIIKLKGRIWIRIRVKGRIRIRIKVKSRIRIRTLIKVMRIRITT